MEIHREWISKEPDTSFFHTHFFKLEESTQLLESPPLWRTIPEREWQILEMFRCTYIHGLSICIQREVMLSVGGFNELLRYGQDYDLWLRLLTLYPATFIPERTCVQRYHSGQSTHNFPEAGFFDSSRAAIDLINTHTFDQLVPLVDLANPDMAWKTVERAFDIARSFNSPFLYALGPHSALLWRIIEWALNYEKSSGSKFIRKIIEKNIQNVLKNMDLDSAIRLQWKSAFALLQLAEGDFEYIPLAPDEVAKRRYWQLRVDDSVNNGALLRYLAGFGYEPDTTTVKSDILLYSREVVIVCQKGARVDAPIKYGAARALVELANYLVSNGRQVLLIGISDRRLGFVDCIQFIGIQNEAELFDVLRLISPIDTLIGISRADIFVEPTITRSLIYQHGPHPPEGDFAVEFVRDQKLQMVVVSMDSMKLQQEYGIPSEQIHLVYNGYNSQVFKLSNDKTRAQHGIVFAGNGVHYKGLDIAVQAFALLRNVFPDAKLQVFGDMNEWLDKPNHLWPVDWLDNNGYPIWSKIERELPGLKYLGDVEHAELASAFQKASLLVMPSRINETFGIVSLESQACGCIPVLPRQGGFPETMHEGTTGYLYDNNTPRDLAQYIADLWARNLPSEEQRLEAAEWVKQEFSWQKTGEQFVAIMDKIPQERNLLIQIKFIFWKTVIGWKTNLVKALDGIESPLLSRILKMPFQLLRRLYHR